MSILIKDATIITMDDQRGAEPFQGDILIEGDRIAQIGTGLRAERAETVIDGRNRLVIPGLVNAHVHSWEAMFKGRYDNMPLELWMLYSYPILGCTPLADRLIYLRTMLVGMEALRTGVTSVVDDIIELPVQDLRTLDAVFQAYDDVGIRANVSGHIINRPFTDTIPFTEEFLPDELKSQVRQLPMPTTEDYLALTKEALSRYHGRAGRLRYVIAPSGPQRCTEDLLVAADELSREHGTPYHIHILETKVQAVTGREFYGKTLIRYMHDIGALSDRTTVAHSIWVTDEDIELMAAAGCSVAHNPISNQKLGAGIAPFRKLLDAGITVALGSDGISSNDTPRIFDVMHAAALLHKVTTPVYTRWPTSSEILHAATIAGARSAYTHDHTGSLEAGKKADLVVLDMRTINFTPLNDVRNHLVYCENGTSVETVIVNGEVVVKDGSLTRVDEAALLEELRGYLPEFQKQHAQVEALNRQFEPYLAEIHKHCSHAHVGVNRYSAEEQEWGQWLF